MSWNSSDETPLADLGVLVLEADKGRKVRFEVAKRREYRRAGAKKAGMPKAGKTPSGSPFESGGAPPHPRARLDQGGSEVIVAVVPQKRQPEDWHDR